MINVYSVNNTNFSMNGDATLQPIRCDLTITINGAWSLEIEVPYDEDEKWKYLVEGAIITVDVNCIRELSSLKQRFRIYDYKKGINSLIAIAFPVAMESTHDAPIDNLIISNKTGAQAMAQLQGVTSKYTLYSNISNTGSTALSNTNVNSAIASGEDDCFISIWGGEICYDNLKFSVLNRLGENQAEKHPVIYGRNMTDVSYEKDDSGLITRLRPISTDGIRLNGTGYVDSPKISDYPVVHNRYMQVPYKLVIDDISDSSQTAQLTASIKSQITTLVNSLSHTVYNSAVSNKYEIEYIKKLRNDIVEAVQNMATANIYHADMNKVMKDAIKSGMEWLKDVSKPEWVWHEGSNDSWWYGASTSSRAVSEWVYVDRIWRYFGSDALWQKPRDDGSGLWDWIQESSGKRYGNNQKYFAHDEYVYITRSGVMYEYWFNDDGWYEDDESGESDYAWHGSGTSADPWWFGDDSTTGKYLKSCWAFIDGTYYYFDDYGYYDGTTKFDNYRWDWVDGGSANRTWFGNGEDKNYARVYVTNQWLKVEGDWYRFDSNGYAIGASALENETKTLFTTGMAQVKTLCETLNSQAYTLLYSLMRSYCDRQFASGIDVPVVTITVNMVDLSHTTEYEDYENLEKVCLGDNVKCIDYEHSIATYERVVGLTYDCISKTNSKVVIGVADSTVADKLGVNANGSSVAGGFDTSVIESTLTNHTNELARLDSAKQNKLTAGENITIVNDVISATGGGGGQGLQYFVETPTTLYGKAENTVTVDPAFVFDETAGLDASFQGGRNQWLCSTGAVIGWFERQGVYSINNAGWDGVFLLSDNASDVSLYVKFEPTDWWDTPYENTVTYANCPNGVLYTLSSNLKIYAYSDSFEVEGVTYYVMALGANWLNLSQVKENDTRKQLNSCLLYMNPVSGNWQGETDPEHGWYADLGDWGTTLLGASLKEYYNGIYRSGKLGMFVGGEDDSGTNAGFKAFADGEIQLYRHVDGMDADAGYIFNQAIWTKWTSYDTSSGVIYRKANNKSAVIAELRDNASVGDICRIVIASRESDGILWDWANCNPSDDPTEPTTTWSSYTEYPYTPSHYSTYEFGYQTTTIEYDNETWYIMAIQPPYMDNYQTLIAGDIQTYTDGNYYSDYTVAGLGRALLEIANAKNYTERLVILGTGDRIFEYEDDNNLIHYINADGSHSFGTDVEANPSGTATTTLTKLEVNGVIYDVDTGTEVVANPSGQAVAELARLQVGSSIYSIPSGGGGGGGEGNAIGYGIVNPTRSGSDGDIYYLLNGQGKKRALFLYEINQWVCIEGSPKGTGFAKVYSDAYNTDSSGSRTITIDDTQVESGATASNFYKNLTALFFSGSSSYETTTNFTGFSTDQLTYSWGEQSGSTQQWFDVMYLANAEDINVLSNWTTYTQSDTYTFNIPEQAQGLTADDFIIDFRNVKSGGNGISKTSVTKTVSNGVLSVYLPVGGRGYDVRIIYTV